MLRVLSDFLKRKVDLRGSGSSAQPRTVVEVINFLPKMTGTGGGDGERDIVISYGTRKRRISAFQSTNPDFKSTNDVPKKVLFYHTTNVPEGRWLNNERCS